MPNSNIVGHNKLIKKIKKPIDKNIHNVYNIAVIKSISEAKRDILELNNI